MRPFFTVMFLLLPLVHRIPLFAANVPASPAPSDPSAVEALENYGKLPLYFEPNRGQVDARVRFLARLPELTVYLTDEEAVIRLRRLKSNRHGAEPKQETPRSEEATVRMKLAGPHRAPRINGSDKQAGIVNYFLGNDPSQWRTNVPLYRKVVYEGAYPGVDLVYYGNRERFEFDFVVQPGADPNAVRLEFSGMDQLKLTPEGDLALPNGLGDLRFHKPVMYQERGGNRMPVEGSYRLLADRRVGFDVAAYDRKLPLVIDPTLVYSTLLGGNTHISGGYNIAVSSSGNAFVTGQTIANDFPVVNAFQPYRVPGGMDWLFPSPDAFVTKLNESGSDLVYSTYIGGRSGETGLGIDVDSSGNAYVAGLTSSPDFPVQNAAQGSLAADFRDLFLTKLNATGTGLVYSTFLGGNSLESADGNLVAVNRQTGEAYVTGTTWSDDFPVLAPYQPVLSGCTDVIVAKYSASGVKKFATYLGGAECEYGQAIALDPSSNVYLTGYTESNNFPVTVGVVQPVRRDLWDLFVTKMKPDGSALVYSTYLGGSGEDYGYDIAVRSSGSAYVTGYTRSTDFPVTAGAVQAAPSGGENAFVTRLNPSATSLTLSTYLGGRKSDNSYSIAVQETSGNIVVTGYTYSDDFPIASALQPQKGGQDNAAYRTTNSGASWSGADSGIAAPKASAFSIHPTHPLVILAATSQGLQRSALRRNS